MLPPFVRQTAKDYDLPVTTVLEYYNKYGSTPMLYEKLEEHLNRKESPISYVRTSKTLTTVKLEGKVVGKIHEKKSGGCFYVPNGQDAKTGMFEYYSTIEEVKKSLEAK